MDVRSDLVSLKWSLVFKFISNGIYYLDLNGRICLIEIRTSRFFFLNVFIHFLI